MSDFNVLAVPQFVFTYPLDSLYAPCPMLHTPRSRLTVVQMLPALESGGVERGTLEIARALVERGHRSLVVSTGGRLVEQLVREGSEHFEIPISKKSPASLWSVGKVRRFLLDEAVDVMHVRSRVPAWIGWLAWKSLPGTVRPRFVTTVHGANSVNAYSRIMTRGEAVIAVSNTIKSYILTNYPQTPASAIRVIQRGRDPQEFPHGHRPPHEWLERWHNEFPQLRGQKLMTIPGRIVRLKGHHDFINVIAQLRLRGINVHGLIAGGCDPQKQAYQAELQAETQRLGIAEQITFTGHRSDLKDIYAISQVVCSLSTQPESFGRTTLEALSVGTPVVGYSHGGVGEILSRVYPEGAIETGNLGRLVDRAATLLQQPKSLVPPFEAFQLRDMQRQTLDLYEELACEEKSPPQSNAA